MAVTGTAPATDSSVPDVQGLLLTITELQAQVQELKKQAGLAAVGSSSAMPAEPASSGLSGTGESLDPASLQFITATVLTVQADLQKLTAMAVDGTGPAEDWANAEWAIWLATEDRGNVDLSGETARAWMSAQSMKTLLIELTATNALCLEN